jgi:hypothetical protein
MPHPERPLDDEAVFRTDEQAGTAADQFARSEKEYDPAHPPSAQPQNQGTHKKVFHQKDQLQTNEKEDPSKSVGDAYLDS